jgi:hypothetical protein
VSVGPDQADNLSADQCFKPWFGMGCQGRVAPCCLYSGLLPVLDKPIDAEADSKGSECEHAEVKQDHLNDPHRFCSAK